MTITEIAERIFDLASIVREYYDRELPKFYKCYPIISEGEVGPVPPPEKQELEEYLTKLPFDDLCKIYIISRLGRGDFEINEISKWYLETKNSARYLIVSWIMSQTPLADYLLDGITKTHMSGSDFLNS